MVRIEPTLFGYRVIFPEHTDDKILQDWLRSSRVMLEKETGTFRVIFDLRLSQELRGRAKVLWDVGLSLYKHRGMTEGIVLEREGRIRDLLEAEDHFLDMTA